MRNATAIMFIVAIVLSATSMAANAVEVQSPTATVVDGATYTWGPQDFAGFYYDIDDNLGTEAITMTITDGDTLDEPCGVIYRTTAQVNDFDFYAWGEYYTIGFLAEEYFAGYVEAYADPKHNSYLYDESWDENLMVDEQLSKILIDDDDEYTFTIGTPLKLAEGYELAIKAIDLECSKVYLELYKDSKSVDSAVVVPSRDYSTMEDKTYTYTRDLGNTENIVIIAVHFKNAFRGAGQDLATVDGVWQISDAPTDVEEDTEYGKMTIQTTNSDEGNMFIEMDNEDNKITLNKNKDISLMEKIKIKTADQDDIAAENPLRFCIYKELTEPGTYEIRGQVANVVNGEVKWDTSNFAGFYYDIDDDLGREIITMTITDYGTLYEPSGVVYKTTAQMDNFEFGDWGCFNIIAFMGDLYFAGYINDKWGTSDDILEGASTSSLLDSGLLSKILVNNDTSRVMASGDSLELSEGYALRPRIGIDENGILVELLHEGDVIDRTAINSPGTYVYIVDLEDAERVPLIAAHFLEPISIEDNSYCKVDGLWQISDAPIRVEEDMVYDKMTVQVINSDQDNMFIEMDNEDNKITLNKNKDTLLMENIRIKTADQTPTVEDPLRFCIYEETTTEGEDEVI